MATKNLLRMLASILMMSMVLACTITFGSPTTSNAPGAIETAVAQTLAVSQPIVIATQAQPTAPAVVYPTVTLAPTATTYQPPTQTPQPCNKAKLVSETYPDYSTVGAGESFTKSWRIQNIGTCTWNSNYRLVFSSGEKMDGPSSKNFSGSTGPNEKTDLAVALTAPSNAGTYTGVWKLRGDDGIDFGTLTVVIKVGAGYFAVTSVNIDVEHANIEGVCPQSFKFMAAITTNGAGTVKYWWTRSDGGISAASSLTFSGAGTKNTPIYSWERNATGDYWVKLYVDDPNHQLFGPRSVHLTCTPP